MRYFTSDLHFFHEQPFIYEDRGYKNSQEMTFHIIEEINKTVSHEDELYILGDLCLGGSQYLEMSRKCLAAIKCSNIHIIIGNHDTDNRIAMYNNLWNVVDVAYGDRIKICKKTFLLSHYPQITTNYDDDKKPWQRVYNLCGHTHTKNPYENMDKGSLNIGWDAWERPISEEEIADCIKIWNESMQGLSKRKD